MPHSNGRIYIDTTTTPHQGIDVQGDIAKVLGRNTGDVGQLCGDVDANGVDQNRIKRWSKFKPVRYSTIGANTQAEVEEIMKAANYGFGGLSIFSNVDTEQVMDYALSAGGDWTYLKPRGTQNGYHEPYRVLDFWGYDHNATVPPIAISFGPVTTSTSTTHKRFYVDYFIMTTSAVQLLDFEFADLSHWDSINDFNYKYAVLVRKHGATGAPTAFYGINIFKYEGGVLSYNHKQSEGAHEELIFDWPIASSTEVYDVVPCIIKHNSSSTGNAIYLPTGQVFEFDAYSGDTQTHVNNFTITGKTGVTSPTQAEAQAGTGVFTAALTTTYDYTGSTTYPDNILPFKFRVRVNNTWGDYVTRTVTAETTGAQSMSFFFGSAWDYDGIPCPQITLTSGDVYLEVSVNGIPVLENYVLTTLV